MFVPGKSGNPAGRPKKGETLTDVLREELEKINAENIGGEKVSGKRLIAMRLISLAMGTKDHPGDVAALKYVYDRIDGKPTETVMVGNTDTQIPLVITIYDPKDPPKEVEAEVIEDPESDG